MSARRRLYATRWQGAVMTGGAVSPRHARTTGSRASVCSAASLGSNIHAAGDSALATAQPVDMREDQMQTAAGRPMRPRRQQPVTIFRKPLPRCSVLSVDIENVEAGGFAGADTDQCAGVATPQLAHL